jgi:serine/tyrosine/threonine adenylyltransferase
VTDRESLRFDDRFLRELPGDPETKNFRRQVQGACWSRVLPTRVAAPRMIAFSPEMAAELGISEATMGSQDLADVLGGNALLPGMDPYAACYGGHQFGNWAGQLGDGRALVLGELVNEAGARWELQLKGAGPTPYSRGADGRAVLRSSIREFLCSEAMHHLGIPTTRALALVTTGEPVMRDMLYDGHPAPEPGAVVCRVAPSFLRFGNYEIFASRGDLATLRTLLDFTIRNYFAELGAPGPETYAAWFHEVCVRTAVMIAGWIRVGFVHGVMNTDNMSVLGLTIDYGPYGWIDDFDPDWTPNTTDAGTRRYRFGQQPQVAAWNLAQLARTLVPLGVPVEALEAGIDAYVAAYERAQVDMMAGKLGLSQLRPGDDPQSDEAFVQELLQTLRMVPTDMTIFHRRLADVPVSAGAPTSDEALLDIVRPAYYDAMPEPSARVRMTAWLRRWIDRVASEDVPDELRRSRMNAVNPKYVLRNYIAQLAIDDATNGDYKRIHELLDVFRRPYDEQPGREQYAEKRPDWAKHKVGCSMLSCSS